MQSHVFPATVIILVPMYLHRGPRSTNNNFHTFSVFVIVIFPGEIIDVVDCIVFMSLFQTVGLYNYLKQQTAPCEYRLIEEEVL